ncbi:NADH-dependent butanol dehydrogenase A [Blautia producta]|uniref:NADH-dependent butanol dehydrogenase A n=1 Tax=Blautia producta TaxID=33035 RepID=A0A4P6M2B0_9FIRM|nr:iron-containing alcohol dehydrogenase [Blautia producta]QBE99214.1 NADH-dependent butanol dehydrogenase A [Blautia producta]
MQEFIYYAPTEVVFGKDAEKKTAEEVKKWGGSRVLLVYGGGSVKRSGLLDRIEVELEDAGIMFKEWGGVKPNPLLSFAEGGVKAAASFGADFILAVGGGSSIDTAKGIAHGTANPETSLWDIWTQKVPLTKSLPVGVVLTIAAAGSEMSDSAVLTNEEIGRKQGLSTDLNRVKFAIMNPELTYTLPKYQVTCGIVDIMMHTLDRYFTHTKGNQMTDEIAEALLRTVIENGRKALEDQTDYEAMSELMWCSSLSHNGITGLGAEKDFAPHKIGHELSAKYDVAHGASLSAVWEAWALYVYMEEPARFAQYGRKVWGVQAEDDVAAAREGIRKTVEYFRSLEMPVCLGELEAGVLTEEELMDMAERTTGKDTFSVANFKVLWQKDVYEILRMANHN